MHKARSMRLACKAPPYLWDEFCANAAYLTHLTASVTLNKKTPFELWYGHRPSLSHLCEIGCQAFFLYPSKHPKVLPRSRPCILVGYAPNAKAYRLWDPPTGNIFNSFHVSFIEHLEAIPKSLFPSTTIINDAEPTWNATGTEIITKSTLQPVPLVPHTTNALPTPTPASITYTSSEPQTPNPPTMDADHANANTNTPTFEANTNTLTFEADNNDTHSPAPSPSNNPSPPTTPHPPTLDIVQEPMTLPKPDPPPPQRSSRIPIPTSRYVTNDGLDCHHNSANVAYAPDNNPSPLFSFIAEFLPFHDTHYLHPCHLDAETFDTINSVITALHNDSITLEIDPDDEPSWRKAVSSLEREYWIAGAHDELKSLEDLNVFVLVPRSDVPRNQRPLLGKLVCKRKCDKSGNIIRYKVRYIAKGYAQQPGIDYDKTTAPTARLESLHTILHIASSSDWDIQHFDVKTAFLHGVLPETETMYMEQPDGFKAPGKDDWVMKLMKSIYGMKQASHIWNLTFNKAIESLSFKCLPCEWCVYLRHSHSGTVIFVIHVDDIISASTSPAENQRFKQQLQGLWEISDLSPVKHALGISVSRNTDNHTITLSQQQFIDRIMEQFSQSSTHPTTVPMATGIQLQRPDKAITDASLTAWQENTLYQSLIGSLIYLANATRPDIAYAVGRLASFMDCYEQDHWNAAIRVLRYLKGTRSLGLTLGGNSSLELVGYSDSDYANCLDTSRSVGGYCFHLGSGVISWSSRKQRTVADSSCYAEYIALHDASHEAIFLRQMLLEIGYRQPRATMLHCDNDAASRLAKA